MIIDVQDKGRDWRGCLGTVAVILALLVAIVLLAWGWFHDLDSDTAQTWAFAATAAFVVGVPVAAFAGWHFGHTEERGTLRGLDTGIDKVVGAADKMLTTKVTAQRAIKQATAEPPSYVVLPPAEPAYTLRRQLPSGDVIDIG